MPVAEIFSTEALATASADISYDEKDDETYVMSESDPEESLVSDYDVTNDYLKQALDLDHADDNHVSLLEDARSTVKTETTQVSEKKSDATSASGEPHSFVQFLMKHEIPRKVFHSLHGFITLGLYILGWSKFDAAKIVWTLFVLVFANDVVRLNFPAVNDLVLPYVRHFIRKYEATLWNGIVFFLAGAGLVLSYAPKDVAVVSIVLLSWADTAASTVGRAFGRYTPSVRCDKSLAGCLASAFTGLCVCYFFYGYIVPRYPEVNTTNELLWAAETSKLNIHVFALITAFITSFSEFVDIGLVDDNFTIPVLCAICLSMVAHAAKI
ncbi:hypothetical protein METBISCDRAFT_25362 [Metschnikowia bicuspidata]|uniref:Phosphatidate cytidylyltransferase n=1 Tax=Metschnikowia bicuspidata TaxID=27322 RepID=A0A4P9ZK35_9ASCO|nr:hypothetical protein METBISCDRAFT_25362 [Metschnikowia bicuspidata]